MSAFERSQVDWYRSGYYLLAKSERVSFAAMLSLQIAEIIFFVFLETFFFFNFFWIRSSCLIFFA